MKKLVVVTGCAGYLGRILCLHLLSEGFDLICVDNFRNSSQESWREFVTVASDLGLAVDSIGRDRYFFHRLDVTDDQDIALLREGVKSFRLYRGTSLCGVIHLAGLKSVSESFKQEEEYHRVNVGGTLKMLRMAADLKIQTFIFSSSATVHQDSTRKLTESSLKVPSSPYGVTKLIAEYLVASAGIPYANLRYFNPVGCIGNGVLTDNPVSNRNNILPKLLEAQSSGEFTIFGGDYATPDGTAFRDYIHVEDLARAHVESLKALLNGKPSFTANVGTGKGTTVKELLDTFNKVLGEDGGFVTSVIAGRREGDCEHRVAQVSEIKNILGFEALLTVEDAIRSYKK
jgi:UDP-glucose 4-epimerase